MSLKKLKKILRDLLLAALFGSITTGAFAASSSEQLSPHVLNAHLAARINQLRTFEALRKSYKRLLQSIDPLENRCLQLGLRGEALPRAFFLELEKGFHPLEDLTSERFLRDHGQELFRDLKITFEEAVDVATSRNIRMKERRTKNFQIAIKGKIAITTLLIKELTEYKNDLNSRLGLVSAGAGAGAGAGAAGISSEGGAHRCSTALVLVRATLLKGRFLPEGEEAKLECLLKAYARLKSSVSADKKELLDAEEIRIAYTPLVSEGVVIGSSLTTKEKHEKLAHLIKIAENFF